MKFNAFYARSVQFMFKIPSRLVSMSMNRKNIHKCICVQAPAYRYLSTDMFADVIIQVILLRKECSYIHNIKFLKLSGLKVGQAT